MMHFLNILTLLLIALKLVGVIYWSWWLVLAPVLIPLLIILISTLFSDY